MKRLALALAAAVLGTACGSTTPPPCTPSATIDWASGAAGTGFRNANNGVTVNCLTAGADWVDVFANGALVGSFNCADLGGTVPVARGANDIIVEAGANAGNVILYRDHFTLNAASCTAQGTFASQPAEGWLAIDYTFSPNNFCSTPPTFMWVKVLDQIAGQVAFIDTGKTSAELCDVTAAAPKWNLPTGRYTLVGINEVDPTNLVLAADCTRRDADVAAAQTTTLSPVLIDSSSACF